MYGDVGHRISPTFFSQVPLGAGNLSAVGNLEANPTLQLYRKQAANF